MNLWQDLQDACWQNYLETKDYKGAFSIDGLKGAGMTGMMINKNIRGGVCLDIGCGIMPKPFYMKVASSVKFIGIDPFEGDKQREFEFVNAKSENLPFRDSVFDGVLFGTSLDHVIDVKKSISEAYRVLKVGGHLFVWTAIKKNDKKYQVWLNKKKPAKYDSFHLQAFTDDSIRELLFDFIFIEKKRVSPKVNNESIYHYKKCGEE